MIQLLCAFDVQEKCLLPGERHVVVIAVMVYLNIPIGVLGSRYRHGNRHGSPFLYYIGCAISAPRFTESTSKYYELITPQNYYLLT